MGSEIESFYTKPSNKNLLTFNLTYTETKYKTTLFKQ